MCKDKAKQENWSERYKSRTEGLKPVASFIKDNIGQLKQGTVLDMACGDGRNSIYLAKEGFDVTGVDFSEEALKRLRKFSEIEDVNIETKVIDVDDKENILKIGKFDNIVISNFKPTMEIFKTLPELLNKDGILLFVTFNYRQSQTHDFSRKYCLEEEEFKDVSDKLDLIKLEVFEDSGNHFDGYIFKLK